MRRGKIRTKKEFIKELRKNFNKNKNFSNYSKLRKIGRNDLLYEAVKLFGTWRNACINSGIKPLTKKWDKDEIITEIKNFSDELKKNPTRKDFINLGKISLTRAAERRFGSWSSALITAGLKSNKRYDWNKKNVIEEINFIAKDLNHTPSMNDLRKLGKYDLLNALFKFFPTYNKFLHEAKLDLITEMNKWSKNKIKKELIDLNKKFGRTPTRSEIEEMGRLDLKMATLRHFGSWNNAIISAGLKLNLDAIKNDFGKRWEHFLLRVLKKKFRNIEFHKRLPNKTIPDAFLPNNNKIIEIKSNASDLSIYDSIKNYSNFCNNLEFWFLYGIPITTKNSKVIFRGPDYIKNVILKLEDKMLLKDFMELKNNINNKNEKEVSEFLEM